MPTAVEYAVMLALIIEACEQAVGALAHSSAPASTAAQGTARFVASQPNTSFSSVVPDISVSLRRNRASIRGVIIGAAQSPGWHLQQSGQSTYIAIGLPALAMEQIRAAANMRSQMMDPTFKQFRPTVGAQAKIFVLGPSNQLTAVK